MLFHVQFDNYIYPISIFIKSEEFHKLLKYHNEYPYFKQMRFAEAI